MNISFLKIFLIAILVEEIVALACDSITEFTCADGTCITRDEECDGLQQCPDGSDESTACAYCTRPDLAFTCNNGACVYLDYVCNSYNDCVDGSDEVSCTCDPTTQFTCASGGCIRASFQCDGIQGCNDASDERDCEYCPTRGFKCANEACFFSEYLCNGNQNCMDGSDLPYCASTTSTTPAVSEEDLEIWTYNRNSEYGPNKWGFYYHMCGLSKQSPIALTTNGSTYSNGGVRIENIYRKPISLLYANLANRIAIFFNFNNGRRPILTGELLGGDRYVFMNAELRWKKSEHTIDGRRGAAELQLIWFNTKYTGVNPTDSPKDEYAILSYLLITDTVREVIRAPYNATRFIRTKGTSFLDTDNRYDLSALLGSRSNVGHFFTYDGSFTSPDCEQSVKWIVAKTPLKITPAELGLLKQIENSVGLTGFGNYRTLQKKNGRKILRY